MKNAKRVQIQFVGGFPEGDYELCKEGFKIGQSYPGELSSCGTKVWVTIFDNPAIFYVDQNCIILKSE